MKKQSRITWRLLRKRLEWAYQIATEYIKKDMERHKLYYDRKAHCMDIVVGDIVLVRQKSIWDNL